MPSRRPDRRLHDENAGDTAALRRSQRALEILQALRDVLREATVRGIALSASFLHFDRRQQGLVGVADLTAALVELRIVQTTAYEDEEEKEDVAECVFALSRRQSRAFFSRDDFFEFFSKPPVCGNNENVYDNDASFPQPKRQLKTKERKSPIKAVVEEETRFSLSNNDAAAVSPEAKRSKKLKRPLGSLLPNWAHARSKRALQELESLSKKRSRGAATRPVSRSTLVSSEGLSVPPLGLRGENADVEMTERDPEMGVPASARSVSTESEDQSDTGDVVQFPVDPRWKLLDLDDETTLSYVILTHDSIPTAADPRLPKTPSGWNRQEEEDMATQLTSFRFTVFLDAFQRVETLEAFFTPLLTHFPRGKILICGFPTKMRRQTVLNNVFLAAAHAKLLIHVMEVTREWLVQPRLGVAAMPQFVLGFGCGAQVALQLLTSEIPEQAMSHNSLRMFAQAQRGLVLFNGLFSVSEGATRATWNAWRRLLTAPEGHNTAVEWHEALLRTVFSEYYLTQVAGSREQALEQFFQPRKHFFQGKSVELLQALVRGTIKNRECDLRNLDVLCTQPFGVIAVHGTLDEFVPAAAVEKIAASGFSTRADSVSECLASNRPTATKPSLYLVWLKSGHEILQERTHFAYELMRQLVLTPVTTAVPDTPTEQETSPSPSNLSSRDPPNETHTSEDSTMAFESGPSGTVSAVILPGTQPPPSHSAIGVRVRELMASKGFKWIQQELCDRDLDGAGATDAILERFERVLLHEARQEHERQQKELAQRLKRETFEAEKHAQKIEELERVVREQEVDKIIKRKEYEAQKRFFEQMEEQKLLQLKWLDEHRQMELEDVFSLKFNEQMYMEEEHEGRNKQMTKKVAALERERQEQERERFQVALQQQRLEMQHKKREDLKKFQKEFEQNQFVCSAVEEYRLDLAPEHGNFPNIVAGATLLAHDLTRFYELKQSQMDDSAEKRQQLQVLKDEIGEKDTALRNLERVLLKAKNTGMIAKAGLGIVRIVAITPAEVKALSHELDEKRDEMAQRLHDQTLLVQELAWQDKMLQQLSVLINRNEDFRAEMLAKLEESATRGNEMVLCVREDMESIMDKREAAEKKLQRVKIRLQLVNDEIRRAEATETQYFDTRLRVEGSTQRVLRHVLLKEMSIEKEELEKSQRTSVMEDTQCRTSFKERKKALDEYAAITFQVETCKKVLEAAVPPRHTRKVDVSTPKDSSDTNGELSPEGGSLSERTRQKKHVERSPEQKRWVALDFELNFAYYYKHVDAGEVEIVQRHPDYQNNKLKKPQLERLLTLPPRNCLALAFLKSQEELEAHRLLRKYTFGDGDDHFARFDREFDLPGSLDPAATVVNALEELVAGLDKVENPILRGRSVVFCEKLIDGGLPVPSPPLTLLSAGQQQIPPHKTVTHAFQLPGGPTAVLSLTISIVFQGHFKSSGYQNGRLAAMLYALPPPNSTSQSIPVPLPMGACQTHSDIALCTPHSLGKLVLRHDPTKKPVSSDVTYQVVLGAPVLTTYSIQITAQTAIFPSEVLRKRRADALKKQELLPMKKDEVQNVFTTIQLSERKKRLARKMANGAKDAARQAEVDMLRQSKLLEADNAAPSLPQDERRGLHVKIQVAEAIFTQQCFLFAQREEEVRDIEAGLKELTKIHADLLEEIDKMERDLDDYREFLPPLAALLVETKDNSDRDAAGGRIARELNVEYVSRYGARSGKVIWAELSAMKAKLPSMMTPAERLRRKYKKGVDVLEKKEREWILLDRILFPRKYDWEDRLVAEGDSRMRLHGTHPRLTKDEEMLAVLSQMEVERIMKAPWNLLERKEIQVRKVVTRFRDDVVPGGARKSSSGKKSKSAMSMVSMLRAQKPTELTAEEREWRLYDQMLNPVYYPVTLKNIADDVAATKQRPVANASVPGHITREDLVHALNTPEEELFKLPSELLHARNLLLKFDLGLSVNLMEAARMQHAQENAVVEKVEMDVDARCRLVYAELQRSIANTRNEFMDSSTLHTTMQRFPTKVLRLELEKELDRILMGQIQEKEQYELDNFLKKGGSAKDKRTKLGLGGGVSGVKAPDEDSVSESDSDEEAQIAREHREQKRLKEAVKNGAPRDKVRGKAMKMKSIQKQRREIKDALQGRSLEEQRRLLEEQELGVGGCMACKHNPCLWKPYLQESIVSINSRIETLQEELERIKRAPDLVIESSVCLAAVKSGNRAVVMRKADLFDEVTLEIKIWDKHLKLRAVDKEFHDTFTSKEQYFETQALHGFRQIQQKPKVQVALQREHNLLVSNLTAYEVVEDILEFMLEGWVFGERESERKAMGYVPSLKREGPLTMHDLRRLEEEKRLVDAQNSLKEEENVQGIPLDKWKPIEVAAFEINEKNKAVKKGSDLDKQLTETENALKFGIFCMTLMYFRGLSLLKKQKTVWSTSALKGSSKQPVHSAERKRVETEARNVAARQKKAEQYDAKARLGMARKQKLADQRTAAYRKRMVLENQKAKREARAAVQIQRIFRGFMGRRAGKKWMLRRREIDAQRALDKAAAITLQRAYRGRLGRLQAEERRIELAEFISQIRAEEAIEEEEEYWRKHRVERIARQVAAYIKKQA